MFLLFYVYLALEVKKKRQVSLLVSSCPNGLVVRCPLSSLRNLELIPNQTLFPERQLAGFSAHLFFREGSKVKDRFLTFGCGNKVYDFNFVISFVVLSGKTETFSARVLPM